METLDNLDFRSVEVVWVGQGGDGMFVGSTGSSFLLSALSSGESCTRDKARTGGAQRDGLVVSL